MSMALLAFGALPMAALQSHTLSSSKLAFPRSNFFGTTLSSPFLRLSISPPSLQSSFPPAIYCGRGDKKTARGKRFRHSYGNARPRNKKKGRGPPRASTPPRPRKENPEDNEIEEVEIDESLFEP
ncbi:30S ribosomal protein S31 [Asimina triloba]